MMQRLPDWPERLMTHIAEQQAQPFRWGRADCATLFAGAVEAVTGHDPLAAFGAWRCERTAVRMLAAADCESVREFCRRAFDEISVAEARRGDLVFTADHAPLMCPAIVTGALCVSRDAHGWIAFPRSAAVKAYRNGD